MFFERGVQVVQHQSGFDHGCTFIRVDGQNVAHVLGMVNDQARAHGLPALAGTTSPRHDGHSQIAANLQRQRHVGTAARHKYPDRHGLVDGGVGGVAAAVGR